MLGGYDTKIIKIYIYWRVLQNEYTLFILTYRISFIIYVYVYSRLFRFYDLYQSIIFQKRYLFLQLKMCFSSSSFIELSIYSVLVESNIEIEKRHWQYINLWQCNPGTIISIIVILLEQQQLIHHAAVTVRDLMINQCKHLPAGQPRFLVYYRELINAMNQFDQVVRALSRISPTYSLHFNILFTRS